MFTPFQFDGTVPEFLKDNILHECMSIMAMYSNHTFKRIEYNENTLELEASIIEFFLEDKHGSIFTTMLTESSDKTSIVLHGKSNTEELIKDVHEYVKSIQNLYDKGNWIIKYIANFKTNYIALRIGDWILPNLSRKPDKYQPPYLVIPNSQIHIYQTVITRVGSINVNQTHLCS